MTKNEIVAKWMGTETRQRVIFSSGTMEINDSREYNNSYDLLIPAWVKFRDLQFKEDVVRWHEHQILILKIRLAITDGTINKAFDELVKGIEWYNSLNNKS